MTNPAWSQNPTPFFFASPLSIFPYPCLVFPYLFQLSALKENKFPLTLFFPLPIPASPFNLCVCLVLIQASEGSIFSLWRQTGTLKAKWHFEGKLALCLYLSFSFWYKLKPPSKTAPKANHDPKTDPKASPWKGWRQTGTLKANWHFAFTFPFPFGTNPNPLQRLLPKPIMTPKLTPKPPLEKLKAKWHFSISNFLTFVKTILFLLFSHVLSFIFLCVFLLFLLIGKTSPENFQVPKGKKRCPFLNHSQMLF